MTPEKNREFIPASEISGILAARIDALYVEYSQRVQETRTAANGVVVVTRQVVDLGDGKDLRNFLEREAFLRLLADQLGVELPSDLPSVADNHYGGEIGSFKLPQ